MLLSNCLDNVPNSSKFVDLLSIEKCYQIMCHHLGLPSSSLSHAGSPSSLPGKSRHHRHQSIHNHNRFADRQRNVRSSSRRHSPSSALPNASRPRLKPFHSHALVSVISFFIVLLSNGQMTSVYGEHSRDSFNSIYTSNNNYNHSAVNNVMETITQTKNDLNASSSAAVSGDDINDLFNIDAAELNDELLKNVTADHEDRHQFSSHRAKRVPIYQNEFAVYVPNGDTTADEVAHRHGFSNMGAVSRQQAYSYIKRSYKINELVRLFVGDWSGSVQNLPKKHISI